MLGSQEWAAISSLRVASQTLPLHWNLGRLPVGRRKTIVPGWLRKQPQQGAGRCVSNKAPAGTVRLCKAWASGCRGTRGSRRKPDSGCCSVRYWQAPIKKPGSQGLCSPSCSLHSQHTAAQSSVSVTTVCLLSHQDKVSDLGYPHSGKTGRSALPGVARQ